MSNPCHQPLFPIFVNLRGQRCTVIGGGRVAARKAGALIEAGATVKVISPRVCGALRQLLESSQLSHVEREYRAGDLAGSLLVFAATDAPETNAAVSREAQSLGILINVADDPERCSFILPSRIVRSPIQIAISTHGASPALARHLKERVSEALPFEYQQLADLLGRLRSEMGATDLPSSARAARWQQVVESEVLSLLRAHRAEEAEAAARRILGLPPTREKKVAARTRLVVGTRGSKLARAQTQWVCARLREISIDAESKTVRTSGDRRKGLLGPPPLGAFVREIEDALRRGEIDVAVHSLKDLPTGDREGLTIAAVPIREDPRDALVSVSGHGLAGLPPNSRVATSSPRRLAFGRAFRPDLVFVAVSGNVDTRLRKLSQGECDALIVAYAGLTRLGLSDRVSELIPPEVMPPAPGQGALALQVRASSAVAKQLAALDHCPTRCAVTAERAFLAALGEGCSLPAGALGEVEGDGLVLQGAVADLDGNVVIRGRVEGSASTAEDIGKRLAEQVLAGGAKRLLEECQ